MPESQEENLLSRVHRLEQEVERLKRAVLKQEAPSNSVPPTNIPSLFGSVRGEDITEAMIEEAKRSLFRSVEDL
jgi:hypothetical protein